MSSDPAPPSVVIRPLEPEDSISAITELLHRAYAPHAARGLRYLATHQDDDVTIRRAATGTCFVAVKDGRIVGTITVRTAAQTAGCEWYDRPEVASFGQFAVEPAEQGTGLGTELLTIAERHALASGAGEIALDTAETSERLIAWYERHGYRRVGSADWRPVTNYVSAVLSKRLREP